MITANELRIGNILKDWFDKRPFPLSAYTIKAEDIVEIDTDLDKEEWFLGFPLTPELLETCGIHKYGSAGYLVGKYFLWYPGFCFGRLDAGCFTKLEYLHQLQNLFFALTGEELQIKL